MITTHNILKMAEHIVRHGEGHPDRRIMHPARDWFIGLVGTALLFLVASVGAGYLFWQKSNSVTNIREVTIDTVTYDQKLVALVLADYRARKVRHESLLETIPASVSAPVTATTTIKALGERVTPVAEEGALRVE